MTSPAIAWREERREAYEREQLCLAYVNGPLPRNDPRLLAPTRCRVLKAFGAFGRRVEPGETIELQYHDARSMAALHRVEILK